MKQRYVYSTNGERSSVLPLWIGKVFLASPVTWIYLVFFRERKKKFVDLWFRSQAPQGRDSIVYSSLYP